MSLIIFQRDFYVYSMGLVPPHPPLRSLWFTFSSDRSFVFTTQLNIPFCLLSPHPAPSATLWSLSTESLCCKVLGIRMKRTEMQGGTLKNYWSGKHEKNLLFTSEIQCGSRTSKKYDSLKGTLPPCCDASGVHLNMFTGDILKRSHYLWPKLTKVGEHQCEQICPPELRRMN